ncbi:flagellar hook-length control protein FliK [Cohnella zeiphila]|uniref:Flagellar hook-length control protein FliK n=1 Tax=Cohnella zeiphila TaxID=2761120 RepID=A0A7X0SMQ8_9BACL|nr:flagellar hook-length control protein FliK [Cohnella zeiphila]MBB6732853.1 flagellar hook-length control protein FliK [Cohnella zeiphila]
MNLAINPVMTAPVNGGSNGAASGAGAKGTGFAGALVQALGGTNPQQPNGGGFTLPIAFASLLAQSGNSDAGQTGSVLMSLLGNLLKQLQPNQDDKGAATTPSDDWAQLLAGLQALLGQLLSGLQPQNDPPGAQSEPVDATSSVADGTASSGIVPGAVAMTASPLPAALLPLLPTLQQALQQLAAAPGATDDQTAAAQAVLAWLNGSGLAQTAQSQGDAAAATALQAAQDQAANPLQVSRNASQQPEIAVVQTDTRPSVAAFKEPIVHWHWTQAENAQAAEPAAVAGADDAQAAGDHTAALPWTMTAPHQAAGAQQAPAAVLPEPVPVRQFAQQVGPYLVRQFVLSGGNGVTEAKLTLHPEQLGQVDVRIVMQDGQMTAQFIAHNGSAKEQLENQMGLLRTALQNQGIDVDRMDVYQQQEWTGSAAFQGQEQRHSGSRHGGEPGGGGGGSRFEDQTEFEAELERTSALREAGYGGELNVTA